MNTPGTYQVFYTTDGWLSQAKTRIYYSLNAAITAAKGLADAGYTASVEEVLDYDLGRMVWSSGGKGR